MNRLRLITDMDILGTPGLCSAEPRLTARAIVRNPQGQYAVVCEKKHGFYALPGGGMEPGEDPVVAVRREVLEETGCECRLVQPLGYVEENRAHCGSTRISYWFEIWTDSTELHPQFTPEETALETTVEWCSLEETCRRIMETVYESPHRRFLQARDTAALQSYLAKQQNMK